MENKYIGVIGCGVVGGNTIRLLTEKGKYAVLSYDKHKDSNSTITEIGVKCTAIFLCLPTPFKPSGEIDLSYLEEVLEQLPENKYIAIRSTVVPYTCKILAEKYHQNIVMIPEFLTEKNPWKDTINANRVVIGGNGYESELFAVIMKGCYERTDILIVDSWEAEAYKYLCNCLLAFQITASNQMAEIFCDMGINYEVIRSMLMYDSRIGTNTKIAPDGQKGFGGKCFPKDMEAIAYAGTENNSDTRFIKEAISFNKRIREVHDWQDIAGAVSGCKYV